MKKFFFFTIIMLPLIFAECTAETPATPPAKGNAGTIVQLTNESFKKMIFNDDVNKEWKFEGKKPSLIDFYADWCGPCRQLSPLIEEIAKEYSGKIDVYKVDTEKEKILSQSLGITGLPTLLFIPAEGKPQVAMGALPKEHLVKAVNEILLNK